MDKTDLRTIFTIFITGIFFGLGFTLSVTVVCALIKCLGIQLW